MEQKSRLQGVLQKGGAVQRMTALSELLAKAAGWSVKRYDRDDPYAYYLTIEDKDGNQIIGTWIEEGDDTQWFDVSVLAVNHFEALVRLARSVGGIEPLPGESTLVAEHEEAARICAAIEAQAAQLGGKE